MLGLVVPPQLESYRLSKSNIGHIFCSDCALRFFPHEPKINIEPGRFEKTCNTHLLFTTLLCNNGNRTGWECLPINVNEDDVGKQVAGNSQSAQLKSAGVRPRPVGSCDREEMIQPRKLVGRCPVLFLLALCFDVLGLSLILTGIFADFQLDGRSFGEFIIYSGGILLFFSLLWWLSWYSFNLEVSMDDLMKDIPVVPRRNNLVQLARKFSERFSKRKKGVTRQTSSVHAPSTPNLPSEPQTPSVFVNIGFNSQLETPTYEQKYVELSTVSSLNGLRGETVGALVMVDRLV
ncbi:uncharacterized protein LOC142095429 [Mixophyes fleayi]|uniref:uncharacterized protein LOC142095429 n=1 Tax=Mixophyes fleayi TaxID=3061075 RepID=UPI003F4D9801